MQHIERKAGMRLYLEIVHVLPAWRQWEDMLIIYEQIDWAVLTIFSIFIEVNGFIT